MDSPSKYTYGTLSYRGSLVYIVTIHVWFCLSKAVKLYTFHYVPSIECYNAGLPVVGLVVNFSSNAGIQLGQATI